MYCTCKGFGCHWNSWTKSSYCLTGSSFGIIHPQQRKNLDISSLHVAVIPFPARDACLQPLLLLARLRCATATTTAAWATLTVTLWLRLNPWLSGAGYARCSRMSSMSRMPWPPKHRCQAWHGMWCHTSVHGDGALCGWRRDPWNPRDLRDPTDTGQPRACGGSWCCLAWGKGPAPEQWKAWNHLEAGPRPVEVVQVPCMWHRWDWTSHLPCRGIEAWRGRCHDIVLANWAWLAQRQPFVDAWHVIWVQTGEAAQDIASGKFFHANGAFALWLLVILNFWLWTLKAVAHSVVVNGFLR